MNKTLLFSALAAACTIGGAIAVPASSSEEISKTIASHNRAVHVKDGWIRDPCIAREPDSTFSLTGAAKPSAFKETPNHKHEHQLKT